MRKHNHLPCPVSKASYLLDRGQGAVVVEARYWVIDHNDLVAETGVLVKRREKESEGQRIAISRTESVAERRLPQRGLTPHGNGCVVDDHVVGTSRSASRVHGSHAIQSEASVKSLQVQIHCGLVASKHRRPVVVERCSGLISLLLRYRLGCLLRQIVIAKCRYRRGVPRLHGLESRKIGGYRCWVARCRLFLNQLDSPVCLLKSRAKSRERQPMRFVGRDCSPRILHQRHAIQRCGLLPTQRRHDRFPCRSPIAHNRPGVNIDVWQIPKTRPKLSSLHSDPNRPFECRGAVVSMRTIDLFKSFRNPPLQVAVRRAEVRAIVVDNRRPTEIPARKTDT